MQVLLKGVTAELLLAAIATAHVYYCPYAKVEESFNLQATHDLLLLGPSQINAFDHLEFPGVVPRTFLGSLAVAALSSPIAWALQFFGAPKFALQLAVRWVLAMLTVSGLVFFSRSVASRFGKDAGKFFLLICACQFHLMFYAGRTLPNTYALALVLYALGNWLQGRWHRTVALLSFTTIVFRGDTAVLFAPLLLSMLLTRRVSIFKIIWWGFSSSVVSLALTVLVDSYFWQRWLWPEGEVLWFNTVENKSSEWGVSPPLWYFYSALPRALLATLVLIPLGISTLLPTVLKSRSFRELVWAFKAAPLIDWSVMSVVWPVIVYLGLFSILPHKELRFIFNAIPILNMASAVGVTKLYRNRHKARFPLVGAAGVIIVTLLGATVLFMAARVNYPGGHAFARLHQIGERDQFLPRTVHIDVPAAMTGVSRFGEEYPAWTYSKDENVTTIEQLEQFDYLLTHEDPVNLEHQFQYVGGFDAFHRVGTVNGRLAFETKSYVHLMRNRRIAP